MLAAALEGSLLAMCLMYPEEVTVALNRGRPLKLHPLAPTRFARQKACRIRVFRASADR